MPVTSSWWIVPFIVISYPSLFPVTFFSWKSILPGMNMGYTYFFLAVICLEYQILSLHFEPMFVFRAGVNLLDTLYGCVFFKIHLATRYAFMGEFNPVTFRVLIDKWEPSTAVLCFVFWLLCLQFFVCVCVILSAMLMWWFSVMFLSFSFFLMYV